MSSLTMKHRRATSSSAPGTSEFSLSEAARYHQIGQPALHTSAGRCQCYAEAEGGGGRADDQHAEPVEGGRNLAMIFEEPDRFEARGAESGVAAKQPGADDQVPLRRQ